VTPILRRTTGKRTTAHTATKEIRSLIKNPGASHGLQLLCANCHRIKTREANEWSVWRKPNGHAADNAIAPQLALL
jgi:hypothetical protein